MYRAPCPPPANVVAVPGAVPGGRQRQRCGAARVIGALPWCCGGSRLGARALVLREKGVCCNRKRATAHGQRCSYSIERGKSRVRTGVWFRLRVSVPEHHAPPVWLPCPHLVARVRVCGSVCTRVAQLQRSMKEERPCLEKCQEQRQYFLRRKFIGPLPLLDAQQITLAIQCLKSEGNRLHLAP